MEIQVSRLGRDQVNPFRMLRRNGVIGLNERNSDFVMACNSREFYPRADNKLICRRLAQEAGIAVPELYFVVARNGDLKNLEERLRDLDAFVMKPACGSGGQGILVLDEVSEQGFHRTTGEWLDSEFIRLHASDTLGGLYSLGGQSDHVIIEQMVRSDPVFKHITWKGVPDIRVVVFHGVPAMAMLRLPTRKSGGRANLHQGAIGAGVKLDSGETFGGVWCDAPLSRHPDTDQSVEGLTIPCWEQILELASRCYEFSSLGFLGVDFVLDADHGPLMLEINARPGLAVQIANQLGLARRLEIIRSEHAGLSTAAEKAAFSRKLASSGR